MIVNNNISHLAIIMDGNARWSKKKNIILKKGYLEGLNKINEVIEICLEKKIKHLTLFALSSENVKRSSINIIYEIILKNSKKLFNELIKNKKIKIKIIGEKEKIPKKVIEVFNKLENKIVSEQKLNLNIAFNYGANKELINIITKIINLNKNKKLQINDKLIKKYMYLPDTPNPDILIRTGGFHRLSNFLLLQLNYTELFFIDTLWPDITRKEILEIFKSYNSIERKYGL